MLAFSRLDRLVSALGQAQPWIALPPDRLRLLAGIGTVYVDPPVAPAAPHWSPGDVDQVSAGLSRE